MVQERGCRRVPAAAAALVFLALAACADRAGLSIAAGDPASVLFAEGYEFIRRDYIDPVGTDRIALAGLAKLSTIDPGLTFETGTDEMLVLRKDGGIVRRLPRPRDDDTGAWGIATAMLIQAAASASPQVAATPEDKVHQRLFEGMAGALDKYSRYLAPETARDQRAAREGFGGIGVTLDFVGDEVRVASVVRDAPADRAGIRVDDRLYRIDGALASEIPRSELIRRLRGPVNSRLALDVKHPGDGDKGAPRAVSLRRTFIIPPTVTASREDGGIGVVRIASFSDHTTQQLAEEIERLMGRAAAAPRLKGLVLDLRGNPGGVLDQAVAVADLFLDRGPILTTRGRRHESTREFTARSGDIAAGLPIVVLVNGGSASSSEIVAAALQDSGRAVVVGSSSYGKGTMQNVERLPNDGDLIITTAQLISPLGYPLNEHGVVPTVCTSGFDDDDSAVVQAIRQGTAAAPAGSAAARPRPALDAAGWTELRRSCPAQLGDHQIELAVAKRLLTDGRLYVQALRPAPAAVVARAPGGAAAAPPPAAVP
jgi:carboxyl-terminal processing protease